MKEFKGRVINGGYYKGEAVVSRQGVNTFATFQKSALANAKQVIVADQNNPDIFEKISQERLFVYHKQSVQQLEE